MRNVADREKVIKGLYDIGCFVAGRMGFEQARNFLRTIDDAVELLKEQETTSTGKTRIFQCEKCGYGIDDIYLSNEHDFDVYPHFCPNCGKQVKWE